MTTTAPTPPKPIDQMSHAEMREWVNGPNRDAIIAQIVSRATLAYIAEDFGSVTSGAVRLRDAVALAVQA